MKPTLATRRDRVRRLAAKRPPLPPITVTPRYRPRPGVLVGLADLVLELLDERRRGKRG